MSNMTLADIAELIKRNPTNNNIRALKELTCATKAKNTGNSPIYKDDKKASFEQEYNKAIQTIRYIQGSMPDLLFVGSLKLRVIIFGKSEADGDNIFKGVADAMQGVAYKNDKQIRRGFFDFNNRTEDETCN